MMRSCGVRLCMSTINHHYTYICVPYLFMYVLHLFIALNNLLISYIPFIAMYEQLNIVPIYNSIFYVWRSFGLRVCVGRGGWVSVYRRLFHRCGASVDLELSCLETLLSLDVKGSSEGILYDENVHHDN